MPKEGKRTDTKEWRIYFTKQQLETAENFVRNGIYREFHFNDYAAEAMIGQARTTAYRPYVTRAPLGFSEDWDPQDFHCTCATANPRPKRYSYWYSEPERKTCSHEAALFLLWEKMHGPWTFTESDEEYRERLEEEQYERDFRKWEKRKVTQSKVNRPASDWNLSMDGAPEDLFFPLPSLLGKGETTAYDLNAAGDYLKQGEISFREEPGLSFDRNGKQVLQCATSTVTKFEVEKTDFSVSREALKVSCSCCGGRNSSGANWGAYGKKVIAIPVNPKMYGVSQQKPRYCSHILAGASLLWDYIKRQNPGDATDSAAEKLFRAMEAENSRLEEENAGQKVEKRENVVISPRLVLQKDSLSLTFKIGRVGGKSAVLKGFRNLQEALEQEGEFALGKNASLDFSKEALTKESEPWLSYIYARINDADRVNDQLAARSYGYYRRGVSVKSNEILSGAALDQFYQLTEGQEVPFEDKTSGGKGMLQIGETRLSLALLCTEIRNENGKLQGVTVTGKRPWILEGQNHNYVVHHAALGRISAEELSSLRPFLAASDAAGNIRFQIGKNRLAEFYYRVLPQVMDNPNITFTDETTGVEEMLPPEPEFVFKLDLEEKRCILRATVSYDEKTYVLGEDTKTETQLPDPNAYRDLLQEKRVLSAIARYFPEKVSGASLWRSEAGNDALFLVMKDGLRELERLGEVRGTDAFFTHSVRRAPEINMNISVESGLMELQLLSKDLTAKELTEIYRSYRMKKRYYKLKAGNFIDLSDGLSFLPVEQVAQKMDLSVEELIEKKTTIPLFRAIYLDHLLEEHDSLVGSRDRTYRALIKSFRTIRDADYDVPKSLESVLRPYQLFGHKWLRTVVESGFGGILADEMGLGKTLQTISVVLAMKQEGNCVPGLIVCPASLVYNWDEEIHRFAPELKTSPVVGTLATRKKLLQNPDFEKNVDLYITSYDLLRQDIDLFKEKTFSLMVLDEAQYIKNTKAGLTKAVKIVRAEKRLALTGTPIENRLAELWSIFDFLMPGFLYDYNTFAERFETPITKQKDPDAAYRLKQMTSPFILRRKKTDVLKDLPPKLEEIRYARFEKKQRELYDAQVLKMKGLLSDSKGKGEDKIRILAELMRIRQICCDPSLLFENYKGESTKRQACMELIQNAIEGGHRMLLFSQFTSMLELLEVDLKREKIPYFKLTGQTPKEKRLQEVHDFNEGDVPVFLISLKAGGNGLNLTGADMVIHYDPWWNVAAQNQATDRAHRIGQTKTVTVYRLIVKDTIEEKILALQDAKRDLAEAILSGEQQSLMSLSEEELLQLL